MKILITGSSGLVGSALGGFLLRNNHHVLRLVRTTPSGADEIHWDPSANRIDAKSLEGLDAVIHLAGESIAGGRWSTGKKRRIRSSRVEGTRLLSQALADMAKPPGILISASAVGYYGDRKDEALTEESGPGTGFLADVCCEWENAALPASKAGIRVVILRIGTVLSTVGGALGIMLPIFRLGIGGSIGAGRQYMSWIATEDLVEIMHHALQNETLRGPVNAVSPNPVTNRMFSKALGRALKRPALFTLPVFAARIIFGEMADEVLLASSRVVPSVLKNSGFLFQFSELERTLDHMLHKPNPGS